MQFIEITPEHGLENLKNVKNICKIDDGEIYGLLVTLFKGVAKAVPFNSVAERDNMYDLLIKHLATVR